MSDDQVLNNLRTVIANMPEAEIERGRQLLTEDTPEADRAEVRSLQAKVRRKLFERNLPARYENATYDDLDDTQQAEMVRGWLDSKSPTLFLIGPVGTGKTHAAFAVMRDAVERDLWVSGETVTNLMETLRPDAWPSNLPRLSTQAALFLFDDLAAGKATEWVVEQFTRIVDERAREGLRQIVTTNTASWTELVDMYGDRAMSRLAGGATVAQFTGGDRRKVLW